MNGIPAGPAPLVEVAHGLLAAGWRRRHVLLVPMLLLPLVGVLLGCFAPRAYEARMSILIQEPGKLNPFLEDLAVRTDLRDRMAALTALLTSRHVMLSVAQDLGLLGVEANAAEQDRVVGELSAAVSVQLIGNELVDLRYRASRPAGMARVLTRIGERFMERVEAPENSSMRDSVSFLAAQLQQATDRLGEAEQALARFKTDNAQQLPELRAANVQRLAQLSDLLSERTVQLSGAEAQLASTVARLAQTDPVVGRIEQDLVAVRGELAMLRARYTDQHSAVQAAERRLARLEQERDELVRAGGPGTAADAERMLDLASVATTRADGTQPLLVAQAAALEQARAHVEQLRGEVANLGALVAELRSRVTSAGEVERSLRDRDREVAVAAELVAQLRRRFDMAKVTGELSRFQAPQRIAVIDRPVDPTRPVRPVALLFTLAGIAGGFGLGIGLATLLELMDTTVRTQRALRQLTGVPVLARIAPLERRLA